MIKIEKVLSYKHPGVIYKLQSEMDMSKEEAELLFQDTLKFLWLCGNQPGKFSPSQRIDEAWHRFILFTKDYHEFCSKFFGKYIHHGPLIAGRTQDQLIRGTDLFAIAKESFVNSLNIENWLGPNAISVGCCSGCEAEHESSCKCKECKYARYLKTPEGQAEQKRKEAERRRDFNLRKSLEKATRTLEDAHGSLKNKEKEINGFQSTIKQLETTIESLCNRIKDLKNKMKQAQKDIPKIRKTVESSTREVEKEREKYERKKESR